MLTVRIARNGNILVDSASNREAVIKTNGLVIYWTRQSNKSEIEYAAADYTDRRKLDWSRYPR